MCIEKSWSAFTADSYSVSFKQVDFVMTDRENTIEKNDGTTYVYKKGPGQPGFKKAWTLETSLEGLKTAQT